MSARVFTGQRRAVRWHAMPALAMGGATALAIAAAGLMSARADVVVAALPLALWTTIAARAPSARGAPRIELSAEGGQADADIQARIVVDDQTAADVVQLCVTLGGKHRRTVEVAPRGGVVQIRSRLLHSGPGELVGVTARLLRMDGAWASTHADGGRVVWLAAPRVRRIPALPLPARLRGLHGSYEGARPGPGGEFRDIDAFAPGDELRRVDWRATARLARRPGDLFVRRTNTLSDASVVLVLDTADELGRSVATWGTGDPELSGTTSLDLAREAAASIAAAAIRAGDRVALHELHPAGRSLRGAAGPRQLSRIVSVLAALDAEREEPAQRRVVPVPVGSIVYLLSPFLSGAAEPALLWRASGYRVVAIDTLPILDAAGLSPDQRTALRLLVAERRDVLRELARVGVEVVAWAPDADAAAAALHGVAVRAARGAR
ncbi:DUF58 domain-containing protein [Microbacterium sp.]|uniref:DUF58 domain-containing protein n=1 Tax=Microbacterium sp. TaxID=51671 RepID=UPI0039E6C79B